MNETDIIKTLNAFFGQYFWYFAGACAAFFFKNMMENFVSSVAFKLDRDFQVDDEVYIGGTKRARIVRQTVFKTVFYLYDTNRRLVIPNNEFHSLRCEKTLNTATPPEE